MAIGCAYCGGEHARPADVRRCWSEHGEPAVDDVPADPAPDDGAAQPALFDATTPGTTPAPQRGTDSAPRRRSPATARSRVRTLVPAGVAEPGPGPDELGRCLIVRRGVDVDPSWAAAERVIVDEHSFAAPAELLATVQGALFERRRIVFDVDEQVDHRLDTAIEALLGGPPAGTAEHTDPYHLGPRFAFAADDLASLVVANAIDVRRRTPTWWLLDHAVALGATAGAAGVDGDVRAPGGTVAWLDGGPVRFTPPIAGVDVVHAVAVEHGSLTPPIGNDSDAELAPDQLAAVTHDGGGARIIAPAGSGKTRVLTERARHLLRHWRLPASAVCLVAFNKRAQEEMRARTDDLPDLQVRTLNSIGLAIVNGTPPFAPQPQRWRTIDEPDVRRIISDLVSFPRRRNADPVAPWIEALSLVRLGLVAPADAEGRYEGDVAGLADVWPGFRTALERRGAVDFDDQIWRALLVLLTDPVARAAAQRACRVLLVDEFQDLTPAHVLLIRLLAAPGGAVFGVGDDDQTIYGYNGADPGWLIDFTDLFPGAGAHPLEVNYRCPVDVVDAADRLLRHNKRRVPKRIRAVRSGTDANGGWMVAAGVDAVGETRRAVAGALDRGAAPEEIAVLSRVNAVLAPVQAALVTDDVPIAGGVGLEFADRTAVRAVLAWLRLAHATRFAPDDLREALRRPSRSFHPRIGDWISEQGTVIDLLRLAGRLNNERDAERLEEFARDVQRLQQLVSDGAPTSDVVFTLIDEIGLAGAVASLDATRRGMNRAAQGDDLTAIAQLAALHDDTSTFERWLRDHLAVKRSGSGVVLATVHRVKGQEWPYTVVHLAGTDQYPHRLAEDVEEERRLFHVALTRASRHATVVVGPAPSPFVEELTADPPDHTAERPGPGGRSQRPDGGRRAGGPERSGGRSAGARSAGGRGGAASSDPLDDLDPDANARFAALRTLRNELRDGKPAYTVFDNKTLAAIARVAPRNRRELAKISGVGPAKLDKYGDAVLELIARLD